MIKESFFEICENAKLTGSFYVSLYVRVPYYGGPEEGGWWGSDVKLVAYKEYSSMDQAESSKKMVEDYAKELNHESKRSLNQKCKDECDWLEERGLDSDYLPEVDGEEEYFVIVENSIGSMVKNGTRVYE